MSEPKVLVAYHSHTGNTAMAANHLAMELDPLSTVQRIEPAKPATGVWAVISGVWRARTGGTVPIKQPETRPADYDMLVIACPLWAGRITPPLRAYLKTCGPFPDRIAALMTSGGSSPDGAFAIMEKLVQRPITPRLNITDHDRKRHVDTEELANFALEIREVLGGA